MRHSVPSCVGAWRNPRRRGGRLGEVEIDPAVAELVPLEDADGADVAAAVIPDEDIEIEDDGADDDTFHEEEEEGDDDVAGLIDGDIEVDEES